MTPETKKLFTEEYDRRWWMFLVLSFLLIGLFALGACSFIRGMVIERISQKALLLASVAATSVSAEDHVKAYKSRSASSAEYIAIMEVLQKIKERAHEAEMSPDYLYTLAPHEDDATLAVFVVDTEHSAKNRSQIGEVMKSLHRGQEQLIDIHKPEVEPPFVEDQYGSWLSAHAPIKAADGTIAGAVGLDIDARKVEDAVFASQKTCALGCLGLWGLLALLYRFELNKLAGPYKKLENNLRLGIALAGYIGTKGYLQALKDGKVVARKRRISVMFVDIRGFTTLSDNLEPAQAMGLVNQFLQIMVPIVHSNQGFIDKYIGDGFMASWGTLEDDEHHAEHAVSTALALIEALPLVRQSEAWKSFKAVDIGIGIDTGFVALGNIGTDTHFEYTAIGDIVNTASRLESLTKQEGSSILVSENVNADARTSFDFECIGEREVRGRAHPIKVYRPTGRKATSTALPP
ncbi:adenylate/guanylate cyclase domain-containing protein [Prosthecobacter sp.]|uniref:adenylate/guanylate cyclase domain-containing protein n=1 Tax=Prosthecobacter sp. TaxID=1965333 RepID=UPI003784BA77